MASYVELIFDLKKQIEDKNTLKYFGLLITYALK